MNMVMNFGFHERLTIYDMMRTVTLDAVTVLYCNVAQTLSVRTVKGKGTIRRYCGLHTFRRDYLTVIGLVHR
jgi:hypothetical protein